MKFSLSLINYVISHEEAWGSGDITPSFLNSALDGEKIGCKICCIRNDAVSGGRFARLCFSGIPRCTAIARSTFIQRVYSRGEHLSAIHLFDTA
jgi:hypothetical protein